MVLEPAGFQVVGVESGVVDRPDRRMCRWDWVVDAVANRGSATLRLFVEVKSRVTPQIALAVLAQMQVRPEQGVPLLCCPGISPRLQQLCEEHAVSYLDGAGNCRIVAPGLYIERRGLGKVRQEKLPINLFATKASRITRAMLSNPAHGWQVQRLARWEGLGVSLGLASRVKQALLEQGFALERGHLLYVRKPDDLLRAWAEHYRPRVEHIPLYVSGDPPRPSWRLQSGACRTTFATA